MSSRASTVISTKGQVILPKAIREGLRWSPGTRLSVEETAEGVLLRAESTFPRTELSTVFGVLRYEGLPKTDADMKAAILAEAKRRYDRS